MKTVKLEGIATIGKRGFSFDSGMPSDEPVLEYAQKLHGTMNISQNGCAEFVDNGRVYLPPEWHNISQGENYTVKRTTRHYIIQVKVPIVEKRAVTEKKLNTIVPVVMGDITLDRKEVLDV